MKKLNLLMICLFSSFAILFAQNQEVEKELIKQIIQNAYVDGLCNNADVAAINKGFHPDFTLLSVKKDNVMKKTLLSSWIKYAKKGKVKGLKYSFQNELTTIEFQFVDIIGTAAVAKIEFYEGEKMKFIDYLSLLKFEDGWKIVSKTYYAIPK